MRPADRVGDLRAARHQRRVRVIGDVSNGRKNALQADPTAAGDAGSYIVKKAYLGDIDGKYWRFDFTDAGVDHRRHR